MSKLTDKEIAMFLRSERAADLVPDMVVRRAPTFDEPVFFELPEGEGRTAKQLYDMTAVLTHMRFLRKYERITLQHKTWRRICYEAITGLIQAPDLEVSSLDVTSWGQVREYKNPREVK